MKPTDRFDKKFHRDAPVWGHGSKLEKPIPVKKFFMVSVIVVGGMALCTALLWLSTLWRITEVTVEGCDRYAPAAITDRAGIREGDLCLGFDTFAVERRLKEELPLLERVKVHIGITGHVTISVSEEEALYYTQHHTNYYLIAADDMTVLDVSSDPRGFANAGAVYVGLPEEARVRVGDKLSYIYLPYEPVTAPEEEVTYPTQNEDPNKEFAYVQKAIDTVMGWSLAPRVTGMELSDRFAAYLVLDGRIRVDLGKVDGLDRKLNRAAQILEMEGEGEDIPAVVNVSNPDRSSYREDAALILPPWVLKT